MQHFGFLIFVMLIAILVFFAFYMYGLPHGFNFSLGVNGLSSQNSTSTKAITPAPTKTSVSTGNTRSNTAGTNSGTQIRQQTVTPQAGSGNGRYLGGVNISDSLPTYYSRLALNPSEIPPGFSIRDISPYFKQISISASPGSPGSYSQITLWGNIQSSGGSLDVTGWLIKGNRGSQYIPQAVNVYDPSGLSPQGDVFMKNGDSMTIYSNSSAIGVNFRANKCMGYLSNSNNFVPPLYFNCPAVDRSEIINFTGQCQNYITSLGSCQMPAPNPPISIYDYSCRTYLERLNYSGCFTKHRNDYDFFSNKWYAWSGSQFLDFLHDRVLLFDKNGLLVSEYVY